MTIVVHIDENNFKGNKVHGLCVSTDCADAPGLKESRSHKKNYDPT